MSVVRNPSPDPMPNDGAPTGGDEALPGPTDERAPDATIEDEEELFDWFVKTFQQSRDHYRDWRQQALICYDFIASRQWSDEDAEILRDQGRPAVTFNRIQPYVDAVSGLEIGNRQTTTFFPRQLGAVQKDELLQAGNDWAREETNAEDEESEAVRDNIICGHGFVETRMDYTEDPDGMIRMDRVDPLEVYPDPSSSKPNFEDGRIIHRVKDLPVRIAEQLFPNEDLADIHARWAEDELGAVSDPHNARIAPYYRVDQSGREDRHKFQVRIVQVEWYEMVPMWRVFDPSTGRLMRVDDDKADEYRAMMRAAGLQPMLVRDRERRNYRAIVGNKILKIMRGPERGGFGLKGMTGKRDRNTRTWYGLVWAMLDPQRWANKFFTQAIHIVNVNAKGGLIAETDAFVDVEQARNDWANADSIIELNPGKIDKVAPKQPPGFPPQINVMFEQATQAVPATAGVNLEMIAQQTQEQAGVLEMQRKQQGMTVLSWVFNNKRRYQKEQGKLMIWMLQEFISDGRLIRVGDPDNAQYVRFVRDPNIAEYEIVVDDAPSSPNMKERTWAMVMQMFPMLSRLPLPPQALIEFLRFSPLPSSLVSKLSQIAQQPAPGMQAQQSKMQLEQAQAARHQAEVGLIQAKAAHAQAEAQAVPVRNALDIQRQRADIEKARADAAHAIADAGITQDDQRFQQLMDVVDRLLEGQQQGHDQMMDRAEHQLAVHQAMQPPEPAQQGAPQ